MADPYNKQLIAALMERGGQDIDLLLDFVKMKYNEDVIPLDSIEETALEVQHRYAYRNAIEDVRREFRSSVRKST